MQYEIRFFTHSCGEEKFITSYKFDSMPFIPRKKDLISFNHDQYIVRSVATSYDEFETGEMLFEVMLDEADYDKEWWE